MTSTIGDPLGGPCRELSGNECRELIRSKELGRAAYNCDHGRLTARLKSMPFR
jgi:hypothetical protein